MIRFLLPFCLLTLAFDSQLTAQIGGEESTPRIRDFEFDYALVVQKVPEGSHVRVWIPLAQTNEDQTILQLTSQTPSAGQETMESVHGNRMLYFDYETSAVPELSFRLTYHVQRKEVRASKAAERVPLAVADRQKYSAANRLVPIDGKPVTLLDGIDLPRDAWEAGRRLYERVDEIMTYDKSIPGYGNGDVLWACDSKTGNCTDFHSLFISLARYSKIPAQFEIGFPLPAERGEGDVGGYHCWARFFAEDYGWVPVDISEADKHPEMKEYYFGNLTENRIVLTRGRDINLEPRQQGEPLNYFVYPYVEVDGNVWPMENMLLTFRFRDRDPGRR